MTKKEFLEMIDNVTIDKRKVGKISKLYDSTLPEYVQKVISCTKKSLFFDDERRLLAFSEIESASEEYDVDFDVEFGELDNDFITEIASYEKQWGGGIAEPLIHISKVYIGDVTKDNMIGNSLLNFYVDDIEFCKKYPTKLFRESIFNRTFEAEIIGKFTMDTYKNCGRIEIVDMEIK